VGRTLTEAEAQALSDLAAKLAQIAAGGFLDLAEGPWLALLAKSQFDVDPFPAIVTQGQVVLSDVAGAGPYTIQPNQLWFASISGYRFNNIGGGVLPKGGTLALLVQAESPGAGWNVAVGTITTLSTPLPGVAVNNPALPSGTWIVQQGADAESDPQIRIRCRAKWASIGTGATADAYSYWSLSAAPDVRRVRVYGDPATGIVSVYLAGVSGPVGPDTAKLVDALLQTKRPLTVTVRALAATARPTTITATLYVHAAAAAAQVLAAAQNALDALARATDIGAILYRAAIIQTLMDVAGVFNCTVSDPGADVALGPTEVAVTSYSLTIVTV